MPKPSSEAADAGAAWWSPSWAAAAERKRAGCCRRWPDASEPSTTPSKFRPRRWPSAAKELRQIPDLRHHRRIRAALSGRLAFGGRGTPARRAAAGSVSWAAPSAISIAPRPSNSWRKCAGCSMPGDALLLGADLEKPASQLLPAYDDRAGRDGRVQSQFAGADQSRTGRRFRSLRLSATWPATTMGAAHRDAFGIAAARKRGDSRGPGAAFRFSKAKPSGRKAPTNIAPKRCWRWAGAADLCC